MLALGGISLETCKPPAKTMPVSTRIYVAEEAIRSHGAGGSAELLKLLCHLSLMEVQGSGRCCHGCL